MALTGGQPTPAVVLAGALTLLSVVAFALYGIDKAAAVGRRRRIPESLLHAVSLAGGWPGALAGQGVFRHKTVKQPFRVFFWCTVVANCAAVWLLLRSAG